MKALYIVTREFSWNNKAGSYTLTDFPEVFSTSKRAIDFVKESIIPSSTVVSLEMPYELVVKTQANTFMKYRIHTRYLNVI